MTLIKSTFFDSLAKLLKDAPATDTMIKQIADLLEKSVPTFRKNTFLEAAGYIAPESRVLKLGSKMKVVPLHRSPENEEDDRD